MLSSLFFLLLSSHLIISIVAFTNTSFTDCFWIDINTNSTYNLNTLHTSQDLKYQDNQYVYFLSPCGRVHNTACLQANSDTSICQLLTDGTIWSSLGQYNNGVGHTIQLWDSLRPNAGIVVKYPSSLPCTKNINLTTNVLYQCHQEIRINETKLAVTRDGCTVTLTVSSSACCGSGTLPPSPTASPSSPSSSSGLSTTLIFIIAASGALTVLLGIALYCCWAKTRQPPASVQTRAALLDDY